MVGNSLDFPDCPENLNSDTRNPLTLQYVGTFEDDCILVHFRVKIEVLYLEPKDSTFIHIDESRQVRNIHIPVPSIKHLVLSIIYSSLVLQMVDDAMISFLIETLHGEESDLSFNIRRQL